MLTLMMLPNGDIRRRDQVQVYVPPAVLVDEDHVKTIVADACADVFCGSKFRQYSREKWTGGDVSYDDFNLFEGFCGLASTCYPIWSALCSTPSRLSIDEYVAKWLAGGERDGAAAAGPGVALDAGAEDTLPGPPLSHELSKFEKVFSKSTPLPQLPDSRRWDMCHFPTVRIRGGRVDRQDAIVEADFPLGVDNIRKCTEAAYEAARREHEAHRHVSLEFLAGDPLPYTLAFRMVLAPAMTLLKGIIETHGRAWELRQCGLELNAIRARECGADPRTLERRTYGVLEAARNTLEKDFDRKLTLLLQSARVWSILIPRRVHTQRFRCLLYRMISRSICLVESGLTCRHRRDPVSFFRVLDSEESARAVADEPSCLRLPCFRRVVSQYKSVPGGLWSPEAQAVCRSHARVMRRHIVRLEALHASFRRRLHMRGVQTHCETLEEASAEMTLDRVRDQFFTGRRNRRASTSAADEVEATPAASPHGKYGGPWRLFIRRETLGTGRRPDFARLSEKYHALDAEQLASLHDTGALGRQARMLGGAHTFGLTTRQATRRQQAAQASHAAGLQVVAAESDVTELSRADVIATAVKRAANTPGRSLIDMHRQAAMEVRAVMQRRAEGRRADETRLREWQSEATARGRKLVSNLLPGSDAVACFHLVAVPDLDDTVLRYEVNADQVLKIWDALDWDRGRKANFLDALEVDWSAAKSRQILHSRAAPIIGERPPPARQAAVPPECHSLGICVCCEEGRKLWKLRCSFLATMRAIFRHGSWQRDLLVNGFVVACLRGTRAGPENEFEAALFEATGVAEALDKRLFWHVGFANLSPFVCTYLPMLLLEDRTLEDGTILVQAWLD